MVVMVGDDAKLLAEIDEYMDVHSMHEYPHLLQRARDRIAALEQERAARNAIDPVTRLHNICDHLAEQRHESPYNAASLELADAANVELQQRIAALERQLAEARKWLDNNTTYYDVDADFDVEGANVPTLAQVKNRIWYHATDDQAGYPFSNVIDRSMKLQGQSVDKTAESRAQARPIPREPTEEYALSLERIRASGVIVETVPEAAYSPLPDYSKLADERGALAARLARESAQQERSRLVARTTKLETALREIAEDRGPNELTRDAIVTIARASLALAQPEGEKK